MQERYLGDSHDFLKYALLRHLRATLGMRLGVNWYLTLPEQVDKPGNNDGEKRHHLAGGVWRESDPELFERIHGFDQPGNRSLKNVAGWDILPADTCYFDEPVAARDRDGWHNAGLAALRPADLIFLDPDNGLEVRSMTGRTQPKYALFSEVSDYVAAGKAVVAIQFARQCDPIRRAIELRDRLMRAGGELPLLPVVRGRVSPNILFFSLVPPPMADSFKAALESFTGKCGKAELIL